MKLEERLHEILQAASSQFKVGANKLTIELRKNDDGTIDKDSIFFTILHYPITLIVNPSKPWSPPTEKEVKKMSNNLAVKYGIK